MSINGLKDDAAIAWIDFQNSDAVKNFRLFQKQRRRQFYIKTAFSIIGALIAIACGAALTTIK